MLIYYDQDIFTDNKPDLDDSLAHYGTPGMKWGVRKARKAGNRKRGKKSAIKKAKKDRLGKALDTTSKALAPVAMLHYGKQAVTSLLEGDSLLAGLSVVALATEPLEFIPDEPSKKKKK